MTPPSASDAARWSDSQRPTASLRPHFRPGITLARRSDIGARPRTPGLMSLPRRRIGANSGPTLPPAPTDKPLAPTVDQYLGSGHEPKTCERCPCGLVCEFSTGYVRLSLSRRGVASGGRQPTSQVRTAAGRLCSVATSRLPERWLPEEGIRKRSRVGRVCAGAGLTSAAWPRGVIVATRTTGAGAALSPSARRRSSRPITVSLTVKRSSHRLQIVSAEAVPYN
jgi:hypothetical protein